MPARRLSIAKAMVVIAILAIDLAWLRYTSRGYGTVFGFVESLALANGFLFELGLLGMSNVLALGLLGLSSSRGQRRAFLIGFEVAGSAAMIAYWACCKVW